MNQEIEIKGLILEEHNMLHFDFRPPNTSNSYTVEPRHGFIPKCFYCQKHTTVTMDGNDYFQYFVVGKSVAECFPYLPREFREVLITGIHPNCWDALLEGDE